VGPRSSTFAEKRREVGDQKRQVSAHTAEVEDTTPTWRRGSGSDEEREKVERVEETQRRGEVFDE